MRRARRVSAGLVVASAWALSGALGAGDALAAKPSAAAAGAILAQHRVTPLAAGAGENAPQSSALGSFFGPVTVVNFWASWCRPCRKELPELAAWGARWADRGVRTLIVSVDEDPERAARFVRETQVVLPAFCDGTEGLAKSLDLPRLPCTYLVDVRGEAVLIEKVGGSSGFSGLDRAVTERLRATAPAAVVGMVTPR